MARPIIESQGYIDISKGNSGDFNKMMKGFKTDIISAFNTTNKNETAIERNQDILIQENLFLNRKIKELGEQMLSLESYFRDQNHKIYKSFALKDKISEAPASVISGTEVIYHDANYGLITLPYKDTKKAMINMLPKDFLIKNMNIVIEYTELDASNNVMAGPHRLTLNTDPDLISIIDDNDTSFWMKAIESDEKTSKIDFRVTIQLPLKIVTNLFVNSIGVKPHPTYSLSLNSIKYKDINSQTYYNIPNYPTVLNNSVIQPKKIEQLQNIKFFFPAVMTSELEFNFTQPFYIKNNNKKVFILGLRGIDIENMSVSSEEASFVTALNIPGSNRYFSKVLEPRVIPFIEGVEYGDLISHEMLYELSSNQSSPFGTDILSNKEVVYIRTTMKRDGEVMPAIRGIEFSYVPK